jgi:hypothetical protein
MALQGRDINGLYDAHLHPAVKIPRTKGNTPRHGIIEIRDITRSGEQFKVVIWGYDGMACIQAVGEGEPVLVPLIPRALRQPEDGRVYGEYEIPDNPLVHISLRGHRLQLRLNGQTIQGRYRAQYVRWINEHTEVGKELLPQRNTTESENSNLERVLHPKGRARSIGEFKNTFDLIGYCETRNLQAALVHHRRTGRDPIGLSPPVELPRLVAA